MASQITNLTIVYSTVYWGTNQRKHQSSASLAFVTGGFPAQVASNAENVSIWWRHHEPTFNAMSRVSIPNNGVLCKEPHQWPLRVNDVFTQFVAKTSSFEPTQWGVVVVMIIAGVSKTTTSS